MSWGVPMVPLGVVGAALAALLLWLVPKRQVHRVEPLKDRIALETEARKTLALVIGGVAVFAALSVTTRSLQVNQNAQVTEQFTRAIQQLGDDKLQVKLGGIYALERIARESEDDRWPIVEILSAYVRENAAAGAWDGQPPDEKLLPPFTQGVPKLGADIQAVLTILGRRTWVDGRAPAIDLTRTDLRHATLDEANLARAVLTQAILAGANLERANLGRVNLGGASLERANLRGANLAGSGLEGASLRGANLKGANLRGATLLGADLQGADLEGASLERANLGGTNLQRANLSGANLSGASLEAARLLGVNLENADLGVANLGGADLGGANLGGASLEQTLGLTPEQIDSAVTDAKTKLPDYLSAPAATGR